MFEIFAKTMITLSLLSGAVASHVWVYRYAYGRGYGIGKHVGFTEGLWKASERAGSRKKKQASNDHVWVD